MGFDRPAAKPVHAPASNLAPPFIPEPTAVDTIPVSLLPPSESCFQIARTHTGSHLNCLSMPRYIISPNLFNDRLILSVVFAMVTDNGFLAVYTIRSKMPMTRIAAHARETTTLNWHPTRRYILATGGVDRAVKGERTDYIQSNLLL